MTVKQIILLVLAGIAGLCYVSTFRETLTPWQILLYGYMVVTPIMYLLRWLNIEFQWIKNNWFVLLWAIAVTVALYVLIFIIGLAILAVIVYISKDVFSDSGTSHSSGTTTNQYYDDGYDAAFEAQRAHGNRIAEENARRARAAGQYRKANSYERDKY
ncbi:hypothetical protein [Streptococcus thoraltensis]|uniref:hypothetical protein n=1 Tax=Streptococcus thoraltensis TaxID=55085 RepID=UPI001F588055|nr:hypothetical protein [Streptococcus thoraltensis]